MHDDWIPDEKTLRFLLGELEESERCRLEDHCLADDDSFEQVVRAEEWLVEGFVRGSLPKELFRRFEAASRASSRRLVRVRLERALQRRGRTGEIVLSGESFGSGGNTGARVREWVRRPELGFVLAAAAGLTAVALAVTFAFLNQGLRESLARTEADLARTRERVGKLEREIRSGASGAGDPGAEVAGLTLEQGVLRGDAEPQRIILHPGIQLVWIRLRVTVPVAHREYRVIAQTPEGRELARMDRLVVRLTGEGPLVDIALPTAQLAGGTTVVIRLMGLDPDREPEDLGAYVAEIVR